MKRREPTREVGKRSNDHRKETTAMRSATSVLDRGKTEGLVTPFQYRVLEALCCVPVGRVTTYKYLARILKCGSTQAVGQALRRNPFAPLVPCHRVVQSDLTLGGFGGAREGAKIRNKERLLRREGVVFIEGGDGGKTRRKIDPSCVYDFSAHCSN